MARCLNQNLMPVRDFFEGALKNLPGGWFPASEPGYDNQTEPKKEQKHRLEDSAGTGMFLC